MHADSQRQVSFDDELLILVDEADNVTGYESKRNAHAGPGMLHRAFSIFLFSPSGRVLLHKRSTQKPLWPSYWTNSCCSHPRKGESYTVAAHRRLREELGVDAELEFLYQFQYSAAFHEQGSERELCAVFVGRLEQDCAILANPNEVAAWRWVSCTQLDAWVREAPENFTPWFLLEWRRLQTDKRADVIRACQPRAH
jgi:isopentenyl-diphosphate delta-isomerase